ncbi:MAG: ABC transporter ATP-binding protein [Pseudohongiella sp.]|uniref:ABC transporter ATP-binding protein n=1 Tax=Pseudohongiella sp. TaxID=1979412 RepID=UPI0034A09A67
METTPVLQVEGLNKAYSRKGESVRAVNNVGFSVHAGEIVGVLGPNGSGKTTTLKAICGLTELDAGTVRLDGNDIRLGQQTAMRRTGAVLEGARNVYWRLTPVENIVYFAGLKGLARQEARRRAETLIERLSLGDYRNQQVRMLSKGNQQKVAIACALVHQPALILLDEPTLGLDVDMVRGMKAWLRELVDESRSALLVTSHDMDFIEAICDRVIILYRGEVISESSVDELRRLYAPQKTFVLQVDGHLSGNTEKALTRFPWRVETNGASSRLCLRTGELDILSASLAILAEGGHTLNDINVTSDTLEDIFLHTLNQNLNHNVSQTHTQSGHGGITKSMDSEDKQ